jgi:hypothetical protein
VTTHQPERETNMLDYLEDLLDNVPTTLPKEYQK